MMGGTGKWFRLKEEMRIEEHVGGVLRGVGRKPWLWWFLVVDEVPRASQTRGSAGNSEGCGSLVGEGRMSDSGVGC